MKHIFGKTLAQFNYNTSTSKIEDSSTIELVSTPSKKTLAADSGLFL